MKAAYAHWLGGDLAGADGMVQKFTASLAKNNPRAAIWNQATWLYATERQDQAEAMLAQASSDNRIRTQLTVWQNVSRLQSDIETLRTSYYSTQPAFDGLPRVLYAAALAGHGKETEARELLKRWPLPISGRDQQFDSIAIAKYLELRKKLGITR